MQRYLIPTLATTQSPGSGMASVEIVSRSQSSDPAHENPHQDECKKWQPFCVRNSGGKKRLAR